MEKPKVKLPEMYPVKSSSLRAVGYDDESGDLFVQFNNESLYVYKSVPRSCMKEMIQAKSFGSYFYKNVRTSYDYEQVEADVEICKGVKREIHPRAPEQSRVRRTASVRSSARIKST